MSNMNKVFAKEVSMNKLNGTSFHGYEVNATLNELRELYGEPHFGDGDKVLYDWALISYEGVVFSIYDWKVRGVWHGNTPIDWHIGGFSSSDTRKAKNTINLDLLNLRAKKRTEEIQNEYDK